MRHLMHALVGLLAVSASTPALAQLQWQSTGVQQVSHAAPVKPQAKAPSVVRQTPAKPAKVQQAAAQAPVRQAIASIPNPQRAGSSAVRPRIDAAVRTACAHCGGVGGCDCGTPYYQEQGFPISEPGYSVVDPGCGFADPGCGVPDCGCGVDPGCGLTYGETCGCGDVGCGGTCGVGCSSTVGCADGCVPVMLCLPPIRELTISGGVQAFKNPLDGPNRDRGNFGFNQSINLGGSMGWLGVPAIGYQVGYRAAQSQVHGDSSSATSDGHTQQFFTGGLFHRKPVGLQYGVVYDLLQDERQGSMDFGQIRGLISITNPCGHEIGFQFASKTNENTVINAQEVATNYHATNQYLLFYRFHGCQGGELRVFGGFDDDSKGILGLDTAIPLTDRFSMVSGFTYVIPEEDAAGLGAQEEAWNLGMNLVWHYGKRAKQCFHGQYRPLFEVADNGSLIIDDRP
ncbi:DUF6666 family protein [Botrimarina mediterranea]|uniref:Uncharacterized protein n=1 Tax=Botrimarina mediterranea TaxID=2528022 RepID=A0A518K6Y1_9BACT|nr:DUF6666 family protein [Botrimarina mediterranea]QDV73563.1 hypothetical protein Spa11_17610 [Botrimarina mediterranea]QDV78154.1 hypothetical protein K2D_17600 [Planctomycetes bacterium K2D]